MNELIQLTAAEAAEKLASGEITSVELTQAHLDRIAATDGAPLSDNRADGKNAQRLPAHQRRRSTRHRSSSGCRPRSRQGTAPARRRTHRRQGPHRHQGQPTTAASRMLEGWMSPYDGTVTRKVREARMPILGKTNLDEFAMGSSNEHSAFGVVRNPWALDRAPGGSGGGSAAAVTAFQAPLALGTDTGGSIRQPAALTGSVGVKPTYGSVSRYGVIAMASSLDQVPVARTVLDTALLHEAIAYHDPLDATSCPMSPATSLKKPRQVPKPHASVTCPAAHRRYQGTRRRQRRRLRSRRPRTLPRIRRRAACRRRRDHRGLPALRHRSHQRLLHDHVLRGVLQPGTLRRRPLLLRVVPEDYRHHRTRHVRNPLRRFHHEVKRRIILGTYALSAGNYDAYYGAALRVRTLIQRDYAAAFEKCDVLISPTAPSTAFKLGEKTEGDPMAMYLGDVATVPVNLAGVPALSCPAPLRREQPARRHPVHRTRTRRRTPLPRRRSTGRTAHRKMGRTALQEPARHRNSDPRL